MDKTHRLSTWDLLLLQSKYLALDFHEERKWKKSVGYIMSNKIAAKVKRRRQNKKLDDLYLECLYISFSNNINNTDADIAMGGDKNKFDQFSSSFPKNNNQEYLSNELINWKNSVNELKSKLTKKFGESKLKKAEKFLKVLNLIENIIALQEEKVKRIKSEKEKEKENPENNNGQVKLIDFVIQLESYSNYHDHNLYSEYAENSNLDYNKLHKEISSIIEKLTNEINIATNEEFIIKNQSLTNESGSESNTNFTYSHSSNNIHSMPDVQEPLGTPDQTINSTKSLPIPTTKEDDSSDPEQRILNKLNPNHLLFGVIGTPMKEVQTFFESFFATDKCDVLPRYNYKKMLGAEYEDNDSQEVVNDKVFEKIFAPIYYNDTLLSKNKKFLEGEILMLKGKQSLMQKKSQKDIEENVNYGQFTSLQKLIFIWAMSLYGNNKYILNEISNMFVFTKNINFDNDEMNYIMENILDEIGIDLYGSNLNLLPKNNFANASAFIESPIQIATTSTFNYSQQLHDFISGRIPTMKSDKGITEKYKLVRHFFGNIQKNLKNNYSSISFISRNPLLRSSSIKQKIYNGIKSQICKICYRVEMLSNNNKSKYDYFNMSSNPNSKNIINDLSSYENITQMKNKRLNRENLLKQLNSVKSKSEFSCRGITEGFLKANNNKNDTPRTIEILSFFSPDSIQKEWKLMRKPWYQNNKEFNPKFKKGSKTEEEESNQQNGGRNINRNN